jgi:hypothetical protein
VSLRTILVGTDELETQRIAFAATKKRHILGRFFVKPYSFPGIRDAADLVDCLTAYDEEAVYPAGSDWSFTRYYFPEPFDYKKFRLANCKDDIIDVFNELRKEHNITGERDLPMQYLTSAVEYCLRNYGVDGEDLSYLTRDHWKTAIRQSGFVEAEAIEYLIAAKTHKATLA